MRIVHDARSVIHRMTSLIFFKTVIHLSCWKVVYQPAVLTCQCSCFAWELLTKSTQNEFRQTKLGPELSGGRTVSTYPAWWSAPMKPAENLEKPDRTRSESLPDVILLKEDSSKCAQCVHRRWDFNTMSKLSSRQRFPPGATSDGIHSSSHAE